VIYSDLAERLKALRADVRLADLFWLGSIVTSVPPLMFGGQRVLKGSVTVAPRKPPL